ncbi:TIGR01777 family oxidoreductase [Virgibacillus sp. W0181]|uniref:TIGR01777 family oxidoreductase n=1 Tax=Virgibacillus sp. W0181 TaxID=3391581 RepID=UPI003F475480
MNILVTGGTGFVGQRLVHQLCKRGYHTFILTRSPDKHTNKNRITYIDYSIQPEELPIIHAVFNLAGDSLFGYWTKEKKKSIFTSRMQVTDKVVQLIKQLKQKPEVLINASAVGYYGMSDEMIFTEKTTTPGNDFLANVVVNWEKAAQKAVNFGIRTAYIRFGVILGRDSGALPLMALPVKFFAGGKVGKGSQWISWIHIDDVINILLFCLDHKQITGPVNATAPQPKRNKDFTKELSNTLHRPYWFPTPAPIIQLALGEMSGLITHGQFVLPDKLEKHGYSFLFPEIKGALNDLFQSS